MELKQRKRYLGPFLLRENDTQCGHSCAILGPDSGELMPSSLPGSIAGAGQGTELGILGQVFFT